MKEFQKTQYLNEIITLDTGDNTSFIHSFLKSIGKFKKHGNGRKNKEIRENGKIRASGSHTGVNRNKPICKRDEYLS